MTFRPERWDKMEVSHGDSVRSIPDTGTHEPRASERVFMSTAPKYQEAQGLIRKYYLLSEDDETVGGIYLWKSKQDAESLYTKEWKNFVKEKYGGEPSITYFHSPVIVDNMTNEIIRD